MRRRLVPPLVAFFLLVAGAAAVADSETYPGGLRPPLDRVLEAAAPDERIPVSIVLREQVERERIALVSAGLKPDERRRAVTDLLKSTARASQGPLLGRLSRLRQEGKVSRIRPLWIGNVVGVDATPDVIRLIARRPEVAWINHNPKVDVLLERNRFAESPAAEEVGLDEIECGVNQMRAPEVWNDLGISGVGAVIAVIDTGVCWSHPDIVNQMWVNPGEDLDGDGVVMDPDDENGVDDDGNGFIDDLVGWDFDVNDNDPNDDSNGHGSHVAGTVAGDGTQGTQSGVAPDARIMAIRVGVTFADEVDVWNAMQYAADNGADSISMSLGWPHNQSPDRATWRQNSENTIDAGTAMVIAAGNESSGNEPDNVRTPGDVPRIISVGATDCSDNAASFSSRGPVTWEDVPPWNDHPYPPGLIKPDVSGPGVSTKSHNFCTGYSFKSGTSMATPHVAGAVALMKSANPSLDHDQIKQVLEETSIDLGPAGKDNTFGTGRVDAYEAVFAVFGLTVEDVAVIDSDASHANGDGGIDTGEVITLAVTLHNQRDDVTAAAVHGFVTSTTPGVTLVHDATTWPDVAPLGSAGSQAPHFSLRVEQGCNFPIELELTLFNDEGPGGPTRQTRHRFSVRVGSPFQRTLISDDFEGDQGWTAGGTASIGGFVREDPNEVRDGSNNEVQPEDDVTATPGTHCWVTGNNDTVAGTDDVDGGTSTLTSPILDATDFDSATLDYQRWFYAFPSTAPASDFFRAQWSTDGQNWSNLEELDAGEPSWTAISTPLPASAFAPGLRIRFEVDDQALVAIDSVVEGLIDEVHLSGERIECDTFTPPLAAPPNEVGDTLIVDVSGNDVRLDWTPPPADAQHDPATLYRVYRSATPDGGFVQDGLSTEPFHVENGEAQGGGSAFFLIVAENGGGTSGDEPN
jgi:serine protease AprX